MSFISSIVGKISSSLKGITPTVLAISLLILGIAGIVVGELLESGVFANILKSIGVGLLASGAFSAFFKGMQATGVFQEELAKVVYSSEFLARLQDLSVMFRTVASAVHNKAFPDLEEKINDDALDRLFNPRKMDYYFKDEIRAYSLNWLDESKGLVKVTMNCEAILIPNSNVTDFKWSTKLYDVVADHKSSITKLEYGNTDLMPLLEETPGDDIGDDDGIWTNFHTKTRVDAKKASKFVYEYDTVLSIHEDNVIDYEAGRYGDGFTLRYIYPGSSMSVVFKPLGFHSENEFPTRGKQDEGFGSRKVSSSSGLMLIGQGFALRIHKKTV